MLCSHNKVFWLIDGLITAPVCFPTYVYVLSSIIVVFQGHCFYHGEVLGMEGSSVAVSTCSGLR